MHVFGFVALLLAMMAAHAQESVTGFNPNQKYHPDTAKRWTRAVMTELSRKHPGFYRYTSKARFDRVIDSTCVTLIDSLTVWEYYKKLKPLFAQIGCVHTGVMLSKDYEQYLRQSKTLLPLQVFIDSAQRLLVAKSYLQNQNLPIGAEILSIDGQPAAEILKKLLSAVPSDGFNQSGKLLVLNHQFAQWYQTVIDFRAEYSIELNTPHGKVSVRVAGISPEVFPTREELESASEKQLKFRIQEGIGILTIHSFAKSAIKRNGQNYKRFIKHTFAQLANERVSKLVIDLRYNTGGTDGNAVFLASHFFDRPFRYWDRIEVTEAIAKEIKGTARLFYRKPVMRDGSYHWQKSWVTNEFSYYEQQQPAKWSFNGKTFLLTNGLCLSSCADFVAVLSSNKKALVVGQETGGGYEGNTSGMMPTAKLPPGLAMTVPLMKYTNAVAPGKNFGRGTLPDYPIERTFEDWTNDRDPELNYVLQLIQQNK